MTEKATVEFVDFEKLDIRVGTIVSARLNEKAHKPAYILEIYFGDKIDLKKSSAQITTVYSTDTLLNMQVIAIINFLPKRIAGIVSEVLVLAVVQGSEPTILLTPSCHVSNGSPVL